MEDSGGGGDTNDTGRRGGNSVNRKGGGKPMIMHGQMRVILASSRRGTKGSGDNGLWVDEDARRQRRGTLQLARQAIRQPREPEGPCLLPPTNVGWVGASAGEEGKALRALEAFVLLVEQARECRVIAVVLLVRPRAVVTATLGIPPAGGEDVPHLTVQYQRFTDSFPVDAVTPAAARVVGVTTTATAVFLGEGSRAAERTRGLDE